MDKTAFSNKRRLDRLEQKLLEREEVEFDKQNEERYQKQLEREKSREERANNKIQKTIEQKSYSDFDLQNILFDSDHKTVTSFYNQNKELCDAYFQKVIQYKREGRVNNG